MRTHLALRVTHSPYVADTGCKTQWWLSIKLPDWVIAVAAAVGGSLVGVLVGFLLYKCCCKGCV